MNIGFIVGKDDEVYDDDFLYDMTPKNTSNMKIYIRM